MELANPFDARPIRSYASSGQVRTATKGDAAAIYDLLKCTFYSHIHVDWYLPGDWLGTAGFVVYTERQEEKIRACLAAAADPLPAAWVRAVALDDHVRPLPLLKALLDSVLPYLHSIGATELNWMSTKRWADRLLPQLGFEHVHTIETYYKEDLSLPALAPRAVEVRPVLPEDMGALARIEAEAFAPLWRHSAKGLIRAWRQAVSFDVALVSGRVVGFQHSTTSENNGAHLARISVHPAAHGRGVGSALLAHAIEGYRRRGFDSVTLNTQTDNDTSQRLYAKFGFKKTGYTLPVWCLPI